MLPHDFDLTFAHLHEPGFTEALERAPRNRAGNFLRALAATLATFNVPFGEPHEMRQRMSDTRPFVLPNWLTDRSCIGCRRGWGGGDSGSGGKGNALVVSRGAGW